SRRSAPSLTGSAGNSGRSAGGGEGRAVKGADGRELLHGHPAKLGDLPHRPPERDHRGQDEVVGNSQQLAQGGFLAGQHRGDVTPQANVAGGEQDVVGEGKRRTTSRHRDTTEPTVDAGNGGGVEQDEYQHGGGPH